jgi:excinuclease UvrABC nuclease subunit
MVKEEPALPDISQLAKGNTKEEKMMSLLEHVRQLESMLNNTRQELLQLETNYEIETKPAFEE